MIKLMISTYKIADKWKFVWTDLNLSYPKMIDRAVPANMVCGLQDLDSKA